MQTERRDSRLYAVLAVIAFAMILARFVALDQTPAGFYLDEAGGAANILCIASEGLSEKGVRFPLFFPEFRGTGTFFTPTYIYSGALWANVFGTSIVSLRAHVAFYSLLAILGVSALAGRFFGPAGAVLSGIAASISPWSFQFSRIAWDPALLPAFLIWGIFFSLCKRRRFAVIGGLLLAAAMYTYPPARLHVLLLLPAIFTFRWFADGERKGELRGHLIFLAIHAATLLIALSPLTVLTMNGTLQGRYDAIGILNRQWLVTSHGSDSVSTLLTVFVRNLAAHLSPGFLLLRGDANIRHGTTLFGLFSWLDMLAMLAAIPIATLLVLRASRLAGRFQPGPLLAFVLWGFLSGLIVSSLTWEGIPHALRSIGSWPFLSLLTGGLLYALVSVWRPALYLIAAVALAFSLAFANVYFFRYGEASAGQFDAAIQEAAEKAVVSGDWQQLEWFTTFYPTPAMRYYFMEYRGYTCMQPLPAAVETP